MNRYSGQIREVINRNALVSLALEAGYNAYLPVYDGGVDLILYREADGDVKKVQLKARWSIDKKYCGRDIWIAFHDAGQWYVVPHDELVKIAGENGFAASRSWAEGGKYSCPTISKAMKARLAPFTLLNPTSEDYAKDPSKDP